MKLSHCPACRSNNINSIESIKTQELAKIWVDSVIDAGQAILKYLDKGEIPDIINIDKCHNCGLEFANPMFAADADWYSKVESYGMRWEFNQCIKDLPVKRANILEIGCGEGHFLELASVQGNNIIGLDFNETAIQVAQTKGMQAYAWDIKEIKQHISHQFNAVAFFHVIEHLDEVDNFFFDLAEIMPSGSTLHFSCPGPNRYTTYFENEKKVGKRDMWDYPPLHQTRWNRQASEKILSRFGWKLKKYVEEPLLWRVRAGELVTRDINRNIRELYKIERQLLILIKVIQNMSAFTKYKGMSMYCMAVRH